MIFRLVLERHIFLLNTAHLYFDEQSAKYKILFYVQISFRTVLQKCLNISKTCMGSKNQLEESIADHLNQPVL